MNNLARALIEAIGFLELSSEDVLKREAAESALDAIANHLRDCTPEERRAIVEALQEEYRIQNEASAPEEVLDFLETFPESFLGESDEDEE